MPPTPPLQDDTLALVHTQRFNHDLLLSQTDQDLAWRKYPDVYHVLDFPTLRKEFEKYDVLANRLRRRVRLVGISAVVLSAVALLNSALHPLTPEHESKQTRQVHGLIEALGICGVALAVGGVFLFRSKSAWLRTRLMAERLRQFHFQFIVRKWPEVVAACGVNKAAVQEFQAMRNRELADFLHQYEGHLGGRLSAITDQPTREDAWVIKPSRSPHPAQTPAHLFEAYRELRFEHQLQYCRYKLQTDRSNSFIFFFGWPLFRQEETFRVVSFACLLTALAASGGVVVESLSEVHWFVQPVLPVVTIIAFVVGASVRAAEEGLAVGPELERYTEYEARVRELTTRFDGANDDPTKLGLMAEIEWEVFEEMRSFLRTNQRARYVL